MKNILLVFIIFNFSSIFLVGEELLSEFNITRINYSGGGDWYGDPSSLPNLLEFVQNQTSIKTANKEIKSKIEDSKFFDNSYYYITGHGNIKFNSKERDILRQALLNGGFLHADDNYGMNESFRREMKEVFPEKEWVELPKDHKIFNIYYKFKNGLPKIHKHDGKAPQAFALFDNEKIIALYTYETDLGDGWEDISVHNVSRQMHQNALKMGTNIIIYYLTE